jgi:uncharacterized membrane protein YphA (DoxX/SURF4 family)
LDSPLTVPSDVIAWVARMVIGVTFLVSGFTKVRDLDGLAFAVLRYRILPPRLAWPLARPLARLLTFAELALALLLVTGTAVRAAGVGSALLMAFFAYAVGVNLRRGRAIPCNCITNSAQDRIGPMTLVRQGILGVVGGVVAVLDTGTASIVPPSTSSPDSTIWVLSMAASATALVLLMGPIAVVWHDVAAARGQTHWFAARLLPRDVVPRGLPRGESCRE